MASASRNCHAIVHRVSLNRNCTPPRCVARSSIVNLLLQELTLASGAEWRPPSEAWWFVGIVDGAAYWLGRPTSVSLDPQSVLVVPSTAHGYLRASQIASTRIVFFGFVPDTIVGVFTVSDRFQVALPVDPGSSTARVLSPQDPFAKEFNALRSTRVANTSLIFRCQLLGFAVRVLNSLEPHSTPEPSTAPKTSTVRRLGVLVQKLSDTDLIRFNGEQLASHCGCSVRHFRRLFKQVMGVSLQEKQSELRMLKAKQMLLESDLPVVEIALACGFHHQSLFHSMFKEWFGTTPGQWRTHHRNSSPLPPLTVGPELGQALPRS